MCISTHPCACIQPTSNIDSDSNISTYARTMFVTNTDADMRRSSTTIEPDTIRASQSPNTISCRHQQQNIINTNHPIPYLECQPPTVSLVPRPVAAPTTVTAYTSTTIHYHQHEARARARASTPAHVLAPVPTSSALRQYRHRQLSRHRYQLQSTSPAASAASAAPAVSTAAITSITTVTTASTDHYHNTSNPVHPT